MKMSKNVNESINVLAECIELQISKSADYQSDGSGITQADYYVRGIDTIYDEMHKKMLRIKSVLHKIRNGEKVNHESLEDSLKDLINYSSFGVAWLRTGIPGQNPNNDIFNGQSKVPQNATAPVNKVDAFDLIKPKKPVKNKKLVGLEEEASPFISETLSYLDNIVEKNPPKANNNVYNAFSVNKMKDRLVSVPKNPIVFDSAEPTADDVNSFTKEEVDFINEKSK